jgi:tetratricopeptide (TPR) repeat protein
VSDLLLAGYRARFTQGYRAATASLRAAVEALRSDDLEPLTGLKWFQRGAVTAGSLWDDQALLDLTDRWLRLTRTLGALTEAPIALVFGAMADSVAGRLDQAADRWAEMRELMPASQATGMFGIDSSAEGLLLAYRGEIARARAAALAQVRQSTARGQSTPAWMGKSILAVAELLAGRCEEAVDAALPIIRGDPVFTAEMTLPVLIEAAVRNDNSQIARSAFATLADRARAAGTPWALGILARSQALLEEGDSADAAYVEAISQLGRSHATVDLARGHLLYGQWLRRAKRRRDARRQLRAAEDMFDAMGAAWFAEQARNELRATGGKARKRTPDTELDLTPRSPASRTWPPVARPTPRSPGSCSSARAPWITTWARCSGSSALRRGSSSRASCPATTDAKTHQLRAFRPAASRRQDGDGHGGHIAGRTPAAVDHPPCSRPRPWRGPTPPTSSASPMPSGARQPPRYCRLSLLESGKHLVCLPHARRAPSSCADACTNPGMRRAQSRAEARGASACPAGYGGIRADYERGGPGRKHLAPGPVAMPRGPHVRSSLLRFFRSFIYLGVNASRKRE